MNPAELEDNVRRDRRNDAALARAGWRVVRVWEHEPPAEAAATVQAAVAECLSAILSGPLRGVTTTRARWSADGSGDGLAVGGGQRVEDLVAEVPDRVPRSDPRRQQSLDRLDAVGGAAPEHAPPE